MEVLEVASGSGEHLTFFARHEPEIRWQPTDPDPRCLLSIDAWRAEQNLPNLLPALFLDVLKTPWPVEHADLVLCSNMIHISHPDTVPALMKGASGLLESGGKLIVYGPFCVDGKFTSPSNEAFDQSLKMQNPHWGVRHLEEVAVEAKTEGLSLIETIPMPANNLLVVFKK